MDCYIFIYTYLTHIYTHILYIPIYLNTKYINFKSCNKEDTIHPACANGKKEFS